ncbi:MAG: glycosyltransferase family 4 protein [Pseudomonadales bacterium]|nr:glycosyltransferase family 4 protein [Pseudomonadales bacterium]
MLIAMLLIGVFVLALVLTGLVIRIANRHRLLDIPEQRSAHSQPTPTAGGLAIASAYGCGVLVGYSQGIISADMTILLIPGFILAGLGLLDDRHYLGVRWRIGTHVLLATLTSLFIGMLPPIPVGSWFLPVGVWSLPVMMMIMVWATNLYNFMDGIDGLAAAQSCFLCLSAAGLIWSGGDHKNSLAFLLLFVASMGFLVWNWSPAKIFMGDTGSGFLGFMLAAMALISIGEARMSPWSWVLLPAVFIVDATTTLLRRLFGGKIWYQAHNCHAYQHAARRYGHRRVTLAVMAINLLWLLPLSLLTENAPQYGVYYATMGILPLLWLSLRMQAGEENIKMQPGSL